MAGCGMYRPIVCLPCATKEDMGSNPTLFATANVQIAMVVSVLEYSVLQLTGV